MTLVELLAELTKHNIEMQVIHLNDLMLTRIKMTCTDTNGKRSACSMAFDVGKLSFLGFESQITSGVKEMLDRMVEYSREIEAAREEQKTRMSEHVRTLMRADEGGDALKSISLP